MKRVILSTCSCDVLETRIGDETFVFSKKDGKLRGVIMQEEKGWILRLGPTGAGCSGHFSSRTACMEDAIKYGYEFFIEE